MINIRLNSDEYAAFKEILSGVAPDYRKIFQRLSVPFDPNLIAESAVQYILSPDYRGDAESVLVNFRLHPGQLREATKRLFPPEAWPTVLESLAKEVPTAGTERYVELVSRAFARAIMLEERREYKKAVFTLERVYRVAPTLIGPRHEKVGRIEQKLASMYEFLERLDEAEPLRRSQVERQRLEGEEIPSFAKALERLVSLLFRRNNLDEAREIATTVVSLERMRGEHRQDYAKALSSLAAIDRANGQFSDAAKCYLESAEVFQELGGTTHPGFISHLLLAADTSRLSGQYEVSQALYVRAISADWDGNRYGEGVSQGLDGLHKISETFVKLSRLEDAEYLRNSIAGAIKTISGKESRVYCVSLIRLSQVYSIQRDLKRAEGVLGDVLAIARRLPHGEEHVADVSSRLGMICASEGRYDEARTYLRDAEKVQQSLGADRPAYADILHRRAILEAATKNFSESESLLLQAREILRLGGEDRPEYASILKNLGLFYALTGNYKKSGHLMDEAIKIRQNLAEDRYGLAKVFSDYALIKVASGDFKGATTMYNEAEKLFLVTIGAQNPEYSAFVAWKTEVESYISRKEPPVILKLGFIDLMLTTFLQAA